MSQKFRFAIFIENNILWTTSANLSNYKIINEILLVVYELHSYCRPVQSHRKKQGQLNSPPPQNCKLSTQTLFTPAQNTEIPKMKNYLSSNAVLITLRMEAKDKGTAEEQKYFFSSFQINQTNTD